jgi:serine protease Do
MYKYVWIGMAGLFAVTALGQTQPEPRRVERRIVTTTHDGASFLGVGVAEVDSERAKALKLPEERGVEVKSVTADSPAAKAGIKENDVVLEYHGQTVLGCEQFQRLVRETPVGREVKLVVWRGGAQTTITATVGKRTGAMISGDGHFNIQIPRIPQIDLPHIEMSWRNPTLGIEAQSLNAQLAEYFGVKEGVLVASVVKNSAAEKAGIKAGDVITKVDDKTVTNARRITEILRSIRDKKSYAVVLVRDKKEMNVTVTVPDTPRQRGNRAEAGFTAFAL